MSEEEQYTYTTINKTVLHLKHVSSILVGKIIAIVKEEFEKEHGEVKKPTYTTSLGEEFEHEVTDTVNTLETDEDRAAYAQYIHLRNELSKAQILKATEVYILNGIIDEPPEDNAWAYDAISAGLEVPQEEKSRKLFWLEVAVLVSDEEKVKLAQFIRAMNDPVEVEAARAADTFRD